jgi:HEAT repeat protein
MELVDYLAESDEIIPHCFSTSVEAEQYRLELSKIVQTIADTRSIHALVELLTDQEPEIRWIAAEGLVKIGRKSIIPVLRSIKNGNHAHVRGVCIYYVLQKLLTGHEKKELRILMTLLSDSHELSEIAPGQASIALKNTFGCES